MFTRNLDKAKDAFKKKDILQSRAAHSISAYEQHKKDGSYIKSIVYGGMDGIITTFAIVAGVVGASLSIGTVLVLGLANLIADGLSMAIGDYLSTKAEKDYQRNERRREEWEIDNFPDGEKQELIEFYIHKGLSIEDSKTIVDIISKDKKTWADIMMVEELGIVETDESPIKNGLITFFSFLLFGAIPIIGYIVALRFNFIKEGVFIFSCILNGKALFLLGWVKAKFTESNPIISGIETLITGGLAATVAYLIGVFLANII